MQAGLSSVLLQTISVTSDRLQELILRNVYQKMLHDICTGGSAGIKASEMHRVAYLTVLTSITAKAAEATVYRVLHAGTIAHETTCEMLHSLIVGNLEFCLDSPAEESKEHVFSR